jgi:hypothetical protein
VAGVNWVVHFAIPFEGGARVQVGGLNAEPLAAEKNENAPEGATTFPEEVESLTIAVQMVWLPSGTCTGLQMTVDWLDLRTAANAFDFDPLAEP